MAIAGNANGGPLPSEGHVSTADEANALPSSTEQTAPADPVALMQALQALQALPKVSTRTMQCQSSDMVPGSHLEFFFKPPLI